ncbi:MAG: tyrosine-type recombinase/integrase [Pseudomonadota bacterium]
MANGTLDELNPQARAILWVVAELGLRPSEAANLRASKIFLETNIPFIRIKGDDRELKTFDSERDIPLIGLAALAVRQHPDGFPAYRDNEDMLLNTVNKYLKCRGLRPTAEDAFHSLQHTFVDRLTAVDPPDKIIASLMGHAFDRPKYGEGPSLDQKLRWLMKISFQTAAVAS